MLKKINACGVKSDSGYTVQIVGPEALRYEENGFAVDITIEYDQSARKIYVHASDVIIWDRYVGDNNINKEKKSKIIKNISECVFMLKGDFKVV